MIFDTIITEPCVLPQQDSQTCTVIPAASGLRLVIKPEVAVVKVLNSIQYRTYLVDDGMELLLESGLTYTTGDPTIALIGAIGGNATGVAPGIVTIAVEWQGLRGYAQLTVVLDCDDVTNGFIVLIDRSESMAVSFGGSHGTRLDFAKVLARQFVGEIDTRKDTVGLVTFSEAQTSLLPLTADTLAVSNAITAISTIEADTNITAGLQAAIDALDDADVSRKVILLFSDGNHNDGIEPAKLAEQFRQTGGVIIVVALRAGLASFTRLEAVASGGFLMSAYDDATASQAMGYISGLKGYLCAGNCCPTGDAFVGSGQLNYTGWLNWDVVSGHVDLIGAGFYDFLPLNGLYMDLVGSSAAYQGFVRTKEEFAFTTGHNYRLTYRLAGNQRFDATPYTVRVTAAGLVNQTRSMNDWKQDFTVYTETFAGNNTTGKIGFLMESVPLDGQAQSFGILLDGVILEDTTDDEILFRDDFDSENLTYVPPQCGYGSGQSMGVMSSGYGYCCYGYGCLTEPVNRQQPDPNPPADPEVLNPPPVFISTQSYTASCPVGTTGPDVTRSATYTSSISLADAVVRALALAKANAEAALTCVNPPAEGDLINLHMVEGGLSPKTGQAAFGLGSEDFWNTFGYDSELKKSDGTLSMVHLRDVIYPGLSGTELPDNYQTVELDHPDPMYSLGLKFLYVPPDELSSKPEAIFFDGLELGTYDIYVYGHGSADASQVGSYNVKSGTIIGVPYVFDTATETGWGLDQTSAIEPPLPGNYLETAWAEGVQYVKFTGTIIAGQTGILLQVFGSSGALDSVLMGVQIHRTS